MNCQRAILVIKILLESYFINCLTFWKFIEYSKNIKYYEKFKIKLIMRPIIHRKLIDYSIRVSVKIFFKPS